MMYNVVKLWRKSLAFFAQALFCLTLFGCGSEINESTTPPAEISNPEIEVSFATHFLDGLIVNRLINLGDQVLAATDKGLYLQRERTRWELLTSSDWDVLDVIQLAPGELMVSVISRGENQLAKSSDGGITWHTVRSNFGGENSRETVNRLLWSDSHNTLYGVGTDVLARSDASGENWEIVSGFWNSFARGMWALAIQPEGSIVMYGGQGAIENPVLRKVDTTSLQEVSVDIRELLPVPSTVREIVFDETDSDIVYAAGEGGIIKSGDQGETWSPMFVNENSRFYFDLIQNPQNPSHFYTAGWNKVFDDPQPLILEISLDDGVTWQQFEHSDTELFGGVRTMLLVENNEQVVLYLGLYKGGIIEVKINI